MRNYFYLATERITNVYNQMVTNAPAEVIKEQSDKKGRPLTDGKLKVEGVLFGFVQGAVDITELANKKPSFIENIRSRVELEQKLGAIEKGLNFVSLEDAIAQNEIPVGLPVHFNGSFYSKGLKNPEYYSSKEWNRVTLPSLYKNLSGMKISISYNPLHLISSSAWANVHGRPTIDGIGFVKNINKQEMVITPLGFGIFISDDLAPLFG